MSDELGKRADAENASDAHVPQPDGVLTREMLDRAFAAMLRRGVEPRHDCRFDGHVMQWNPSGFAWCIYCHVSEADAERPS